MPVQKICVVCKKIFVVKDSKKDTAKYCSYLCMGNAKKGKIISERVINTCPNCGKEFVTTVNRKKKYCCKKCSDERKDNKKYYPCDVCGKQIQLTVNTYKRLVADFETGKRKYKCCSKECSNKAKENNVACKCLVCGVVIFRTEYRINKNEKQFCSSECYGKYISASNEDKRICPVCGKEFIVTKKSSKICCSRECGYKHGAITTIESGVRKTGEYVNCLYCGKNTYVVQNKIKSAKFGNFCSTECSRCYLQKVVLTQPDYKDRARKRILTELRDGTINKVDTIPQQSVNRILDDLGERYEREKIVGMYSFDNYLCDYDLYIEVQGDYWHCNPNKFDKSITKQQFERISRDKAKHSYIRNQKEKEILFLWECDVKNRPNLCKLLITEYINNQGVLPDYNSFNYEEVGGTLLLYNETVIPYQDRDVSEYRHLVVKEVQS